MILDAGQLIHGIAAPRCRLSPMPIWPGFSEVLSAAAPVTVRESTALDSTRRQQAKLLKLRAALSLARLW